MHPLLLHLLQLIALFTVRGLLAVALVLSIYYAIRSICRFTVMYYRTLCDFKTAWQMEWNLSMRATFVVSTVIVASALLALVVWGTENRNTIHDFVAADPELRGVVRIVAPSMEQALALREAMRELQREPNLRRMTLEEFLARQGSLRSRSLDSIG